ncbi:MAG: hypothetical protein WC044_01535 [Crocinitomicaceae bacterium]
MAIATTIVNQINHGDPYALMAWGAEHFTALCPDDEFQGGLSFLVNGLIHKGWVRIQLRWVDDYTISFINKNHEVVKTYEGIYCDQLVQIVDFVEGK